MFCQTTFRFTASSSLKIRLYFAVNFCPHFLWPLFFQKVKWRAQHLLHVITLIVLTCCASKDKFANTLVLEHEKDTKVNVSLTQGTTQLT